MSGRSGDEVEDLKLKNIVNNLNLTALMNFTKTSSIKTNKILNLNRQSVKFLNKPLNDLNFKLPTLNDQLKSDLNKFKRIKRLINQPKKVKKLKKIKSIYLKNSSPLFLKENQLSSSSLSIRKSISR